jgi:colanic acid/amylovoran biosynthesis glycosyltransferase
MSMADARTGREAEQGAWRVAYVLTHYPRVALTFIAGEIDEMEGRGARVFPIVMNLPQAADLVTADAELRRERSLYLKAAPAAVLLAFAGLLLRHPLRAAGLLIRGLRSARSDLGLMARRLVHFAYAARVARYCEENAIAHLHAHFGQSPATIAWFAAEILKIRAAGPYRWSFTIHGFQDFVDETIARLDLKAASAAFVVCVSEFTRSQLCRVADPAYWHRFHVVRCGIALDAFPLRTPRPISAPARILIVGRLSPEKGHLVLVEALGSLTSRDVEAEVEIVGAGPFEAAIRQAVSASGLDSKVHFAGELAPAQVAERLAAADIFCMASFSEGLPISIMEAMAVGVPVVTTWISGIPELAVHGETAMTVPPGDAEALARALRRVIEDHSLRERMIGSARAAVERLHSRERSGAALAALFHAEPARAGEPATVDG